MQSLEEYPGVSMLVVVPPVRHTKCGYSKTPFALHFGTDITFEGESPVLFLGVSWEGTLLTAKNGDGASSILTYVLNVQSRT